MARRRRRDLPDRPGLPCCGRRHRIDERARIRRPPRVFVVGIVDSNLTRSASGHQPKPDLPFAARTGDKRDGLAVRRDGWRLLHAHEIGQTLRLDVARGRLRGCRGCPSNRPRGRPMPASRRRAPRQDVGRMTEASPRTPSDRSTSSSQCRASPMSRSRSRGSFSSIVCQTTQTCRRCCRPLVRLGSRLRRPRSYPTTSRLECAISGEHLVKDATERPDVRPLVQRPPRACSGLMYAAVPTIIPVPVRPAARVTVSAGSAALESSASAFARPKSSTFAMPSGVILMLAGFRSR